MPVLSLPPTFCACSMNCHLTSQHCGKNVFFYCCHVLIISVIFLKPNHKFLSFPSAYNSAAPGLPFLKILHSSHPSIFQRIPWVGLSPAELWIFPLCQITRPHFYFHFRNAMSNLSDSSLVLSLNRLHWPAFRSNPQVGDRRDHLTASVSRGASK